MAKSFKSKKDINVLQKLDYPSMKDDILTGASDADLAVNTVTAKRNVITANAATLTLTEEQSGSVVLLARAAGSVITLPAPKVGITYDFIVNTTVTSNAYTVATNSDTTVFLRGQVLGVDTDSSNALAMYSANGTTHVEITMNGTTTGGRVGTSFTLTCVSATLWQIDGVVNGSGVVATPFAVA